MHHIIILFGLICFQSDFNGPFFIHIFFHKSDICYVQSVMFTPRVARCAKHAGVVENMVSC